MGTGMGTLHSPASGQPGSRQDSLGDTQILQASQVSPSKAPAPHPLEIKKAPATVHRTRFYTQG